MWAMNQKGLTLLELIVVWIIVTIAVMLLLPRIITWSQNYRLRKATRDIASVLRTVQAEAVSNNAEYRVCLDTGAGSYVIHRSSEGKWVQEGGLHALPPGIRIKEITL